MFDHHGPSVDYGADVCFVRLSNHRLDALHTVLREEGAVVQLQVLEDLCGHSYKCLCLRVDNQQVRAVDEGVP
jgi:hypothetical protein